MLIPTFPARLSVFKNCVYIAVRTLNIFYSAKLGTLAFLCGIVRIDIKPNLFLFLCKDMVKFSLYQIFYNFFLTFCNNQRFVLNLCQVARCCQRFILAFWFNQNAIALSYNIFDVTFRYIGCNSPSNTFNSVQFFV